MGQICSDIQFEGADGITLCRNPIRHIKRKKAEASFLAGSAFFSDVCSRITDAAFLLYVAFRTHHFSRIVLTIAPEINRLDFARLKRRAREAERHVAQNRLVVNADENIALLKSGFLRGRTILDRAQIGTLRKIVVVLVNRQDVPRPQCPFPIWRLPRARCP